MEFFCVLSVGGSLAWYKVKAENEHTYKAVLYNNQGAHPDIPSQIFLYKIKSVWQANPAHEKVVNSLLNAIDTSRQK